MKRLSNRVAVVTGAGSGIGRATSSALARRGCVLAIADINAVGLEETKQELLHAGARVTSHVLDVANREQMERFVREVLDVHGRVEILVNNAGVSVSGGFAEQTLDDMEWLMGINFWGVVYGCRLFLPALLAADEAHIVNVSSLFGLMGVPMQSSYCASKFALRGLSESLRAELAETKVGVTCAHPGVVATNIARTMRVRGQDAVRRQERFVELFQKALPPEKAAEGIVAGIQKNRARVLITRQTQLLDFAKRGFPDATDALVHWGFRRMNA